MARTMLEIPKEIVYDNNYHEDKFGKLIKDNSYYIIKSKVSRLRYFVGFKKDNKVLDFGSGLGQNTAWIKNKYAYDLNKDLYGILTVKGFTTINDIDNVPDNFFDEILISQVLEHVNNPTETLKLLHRKLKLNGRLRVVLPCINYNINGLNKKTIDGHLHAWSFTEINYLLNKCGFFNELNCTVYRRGTERLFFISKLSFKLYLFITEYLGFILNDFDILIVSRKIKEK